MSTKTYEHIMQGHDKNIRFTELCRTLKNANFYCRIKGDHHIFTRDDIPEIINIQPLGKMAKAYQVKQIRMLFEKYNI
ncbi:MAG: type II toxin-antitoxin system HicA family toxin [Lachnospiraceae bacterium]|nr:type II toxin-antitoxin system HicA family toxin [Lachnospiraceae bacterium]